MARHAGCSARGQMAETLTWAQKLIDRKITFILFPSGVAQTLGWDTRSPDIIYSMTGCFPDEKYIL